MNRCKINPEKYFTTNIAKHILSGFSVSTISSFKYVGNKLDIYKGKISHKIIW